MGSIEKQRSIIDFTLASLLRRKGKNATLLAVYIMVVFLLASVMFFTQAIRKEAAAVFDDAPELVVQRIVAGRHDLIPLVYVEKLRDIRGVRSVRSSPTPGRSPVTRFSAPMTRSLIGAVASCWRFSPAP
jgi:hypothetical protein